MSERVVVLGASSKPDRYSYMAIESLNSRGHDVLPVHPKEKEILGRKVFPDLAAVKATGMPIDTITMYVGPDISSKMKGDLLALKPRRVIFNPGAENPALAKALEAAGVDTLEACTLVMLSTRQF